MPLQNVLRFIGTFSGRKRQIGAARRLCVRRVSGSGGMRTHARYEPMQCFA